jgi:hypothetical protein
MAERRCCGPGRAATVGFGLAMAVAPVAQAPAQVVGGLEPTGLRTEQWTIFPVLALSVSYTDNVFAVPEDDDRSESDLIYSASPSVTAVANLRRHAFSLSAGTNFSRFQDAEDLNFNNFNVSASGVWEATRTFNVSSSLSFARTAEDQADPDRTTIEEARTQSTNIDTLDWNVTASKDWQRTFASASAGVQRRTSEELELATFPPGSGTIDLNADDDRWTIPLSARVGYDVGRNYDVFVNVGYRMVRFDEPEQILIGPPGVVLGVTEGDSQDFDSASLRVGSGLDFDRLVTGEFSLGLEKTFEDEGDDGELGFSFDADLAWTVTPRTTVSFTGSQGFEPTSGDDGGGTALRTRIGVDLGYSLTRQISLGSNLAYLRDDRSDEDRVDDDIEAGVSASYAVNRYAQVSASYSYRQRTSNDPTREFTRNSVVLSVVARY